MRSVKVLANACQGLESWHGAAESPGLAHVKAEGARGHLCAGGSYFVKEDEVVLLKPAHC